jgi:hypothetical protein
MDFFRLSHFAADRSSFSGRSNGATMHSDVIRCCTGLHGNEHMMVARCGLSCRTGKGFAGQTVDTGKATGDQRLACDDPSVAPFRTNKERWICYISIFILI